MARQYRTTSQLITEFDAEIQGRIQAMYGITVKPGITTAEIKAFYALHGLIWRLEFADLSSHDKAILAAHLSQNDLITTFDITVLRDVRADEKERLFERGPYTY